jgi:signal transduction histidine kinase
MTGSAQQQPSMPRWQRPLLPGVMLEAYDGRRSARDWIVDIAMFGLAAGLSAIVLTETWPDHHGLAAVFDVVVGAAVWLSLWLRRSHPAGVAWVAIAASAVSAAAGGPALMALFNAAIRTSGRTLAGIVGLTVIATAIFPLLYPGTEAYSTQLLLGNLITAVVVGWGLFVRAQRQLVQSLRDRADRLESEQRLRVEQAREAERLRIAREMHDVLAHRISLLSLHAGALEFRPDAPPDEVAEAAGVIRASAHAALEELREVIGVLRDGVEEGAPEPPQPTLAQIPALVAESRAAGMRVGCRIEGPRPEALPAALGRTAYRVVQEGLTNARKHAPAAAVEVTVAADAGPRLVVEVLTRRPVGVAATAALAGAGAGAGLIGLAERVALAGGELEHGPDAAGDFVLRATLPWTP